MNVLPAIASHYRWEGKLHKDKEALLIVKTRTSMLKKVEAWVKKNHPYSVPEVLVLPVAGGSKPYLDWLAANTR